ncbi:odorant receptor 59a-like [Cochliomyia hominivorax]
MPISSPQGEVIFRLHFICWRILGFLPTKRYRQIYISYSIFMNVIVTIGYPLHLMIGLYKSSTMNDIIKNLAINLTCLVCSLKTFTIWLKFQKVQHIFDIIRQQDKRISLDQDECYYYKYKTFKKVRFILNLFVMLCVSCCAFSEMSVLINGLMGNWNLMYPAYFPFDPFGNTKFYIVAHVYQFLGVSFQILQNIVNDTFAAMHLALLSGQLHTLGMRVARLGTDKEKSQEENNRELLKCIQDHKDLLIYRSQLEEIISLYMFFQIICTSINLCASIVFLILFSSDPFTMLYYCFYFLAMLIELLPACYYGTIMEMAFQNLTYALFSSNWMDQNVKFKKNLRIFAETTKKPLYMMAWLFRINLDTFIVVCKNSYSLFALIMNMK